MLDLPETTPAYTFSLWSNGRIELPFDRIAQHVPYDSQDKRSELRNQMEAISGIEVASDQKYPTIPIEPLLDDNNLTAFLNVWNNYIAEITASNRI